MVSILLTVNALICVALIILILLQRSDPASGGMFGGTGGGSQTVLRNPLARPTALLALAFLIISLVLAYLNEGAGHGTSVMAEGVAPAPAQAVSPTLALPAPALLPSAVSQTVTATPSTPKP